MRTVASSCLHDSTDFAIRSLGVGEQLVGDLGQLLRPLLRPRVRTIVPTRSPRTILSMLRSSAMLKTWIGRPLSMHSESAVESITRRPFSIASMCVISGRNLASGLLDGSAS